MARSLAQSLSELPQLSWNVLQFVDSFAYIIYVTNSTKSILLRTYLYLLMFIQ